MNEFRVSDAPIGSPRIDGTNVYGRNGPDFPQIRIRVEYSLHPLEANQLYGVDENKEYSFTATDLRGRLHLVPDPSNRSSRFVCNLQSDFDPFRVKRQSSNSKRLYGALSPHLVKQLDKHRKGGKLHLEVECILDILLDDPPKPNLRFGRAAQTLKVRIPESHWRKEVYPNLGGPEVFTVEIPKEPRTIERAWTHVEEAEDAFESWNKEGAASKCREAGKILDQAVKDEFGSNSCTYSKRWKRAYSDFQNQASLLLHVQDIRGSQCDGSETFRVTQADVQALLIRAQSLVKFAEELLRIG